MKAYTLFALHNAAMEITNANSAQFAENLEDSSTLSSAAAKIQVLSADGGWIFLTSEEQDLVIGRAQTAAARAHKARRKTQSASTKQKCA